ncbi:MAG: 30S ribosomal protein S12 methylthiotransferase RimO [Candidatus Handelsmanbacteria bacterium]|nr:30S ribosomal protein S12 methylthiotransferase RimO [Candidatus Handelsmanbacteria bacterium]
MSQSNPPKVHLVNLGCPKNLVDSEKMSGLLQGNGYVLTADPEQADVVVVNTCGFIGPAKEESIQAILEANRLKEEGRVRAVIATGCLAQRYQEELQIELPEADQILPLAEEAHIAAHVDRALGRTRDHYLDSAPRAQLTPRHWAYLRISDGCDHQCAFCAIPGIRGKHHSEPIDKLVEEARRLADGGVRELVLVSQDSVRYGADLYGRAQLVPLMEQLADIPDIAWLRLMYTYPAFWTGEMIALFANHPKVCKYIDMPLQHIADPVLRRMKRATTRQKTLDLLADLRERIPGVGLRSSFIVGFPGETEAQFEELLEFVAQTRFDYATAFIYSPEEGTSAYKLDGEMDEETKAERYRLLTELQERISGERNHALVGTSQIVLVDERTPEGQHLGRMERDAPEIDGQVLIEGPAEPGQFIEVEITGAAPYELNGRVLAPQRRGDDPIGLSRGVAGKGSSRDGLRGERSQSEQGGKDAPWESPERVAPRRDGVQP